MTKKLLAGFSLSVFALLTIFVLNQFIVMSWENSELSILENPRLVVKKKARRLEVFDGEKLVKSYTIVLGFTPEGDKKIEGDGKTPEGEFYIFTKNADSRFFLSLGISYPSINDAARGLKENLISRGEHNTILEAVKNKQMPPQKTKLGGEIYIHGGGTITDWTDGCVALRNEEMRELFDAIPVGTLIKIER